MYAIRVKKSAQKELLQLPDIYRKKIVAAIDDLAENPRPDGVKKLKGDIGYRIRVGDYRIVYTIDDAILVVELIRIGHRKDIYR